MSTSLGILLSPRIIPFISILAYVHFTYGHCCIAGYNVACFRLRTEQIYLLPFWRLVIEASPSLLDRAQLEDS